MLHPHRSARRFAWALMLAALVCGWVIAAESRAQPTTSPATRPAATQPAVTRPAATQRAASPLPPVTAVMIQGHKGFLYLPPKRDASRPTPWVWYAPTLGSVGLIGHDVMMRRFMKAGIAVAGIDVGESYGSPRGRALFTDFYDELVQKHGMSPKPCLVGQSRGGLQIYNWAAEHPTAISCIVGIYPVCDLRYYPGAAAAGPAYEMTPAEFTAALPSHNPINRLEPLARAGVPILHIHGDDDRIVPIERNSAALAEKYRQLGGSIRLIVVPGQGHNAWPGWWDNAELLDFIVAHVSEASKPPR